MKRYLALALLLALLALSAGAASALTGGYSLTWNTVDGGGTTFSTGESYALQGGFWSLPGHVVHMPTIRKP